jgi:hypothetical protein
VIISSAASGLDNTTCCFGGSVRLNRNVGRFETLCELPSCCRCRPLATLLRLLCCYCYYCCCCYCYYYYYYCYYYYCYYYYCYYYYCYYYYYYYFIIVITITVVIILLLSLKFNSQCIS